MGEDRSIRLAKVRCNGNRPICATCRAFDLPCKYGDNARGQKHPRDDHISAITKRVESLEGKLHPAPAEKRPRLGSANTRSTRNTQRLNTDNSSSRSSSQTPVESESDTRSYALKNAKGAMRFFGASSYFSFVAPDGACSLENQTGNRSLRSIARQSSSRWKLVDWYPPGLQHEAPLDQRCSQPLPTKSLFLELVDEYFRTINVVSPLFNQTNFMKLVNRHFSWNPDTSPSWWGALNVVLAFAYRNRAEKPGNSGDEWSKCIRHIKNAMNVTTELFMRTCDLLAVQTMIGLALFFQGTPNPQPLFMFTAAAIRFSLSIGLHKANFFGLSELQVQKRRRVFWIAFVLDADVCTRTGRPAAQDIRDFDTPLPLGCPQDNLGVIELQGVTVNFFSVLVQLGLIQRKGYDRIYTKEALEKPMSERADRARACIAELDQWRDSIPLCIRPQRNFSAEYHHFLPQVIRLHFAHHCFCVNFCRVILSSEEQQRIAREEATAKSLEAAMSAIELISQIHDDRFGQSFQWSVVYFPAAAAGGLFSHIMLQPNHPRAESDLLMITQTVGLLSQLASQEQDTYADYVLSLCSGFEKAARGAIDLSISKGHQMRSAVERLRSSNGQLIPDLQEQEPEKQGAPPSCDSTAGYIDPNLMPNDNVSRPMLDVPLGEDPVDTTDSFSFPSPLVWNWQDALGGVPPDFYWNI
ncbi:hypothetical protein BJY04DRAFT_233247 [Aspergillus karnatakaensis]|uniref:uncharacterized protein n=1 Tax=Aspergillus karnatakaensis TaxID=1810916 RepID=UPI003CCCD25B